MLQLHQSAFTLLSDDRTLKPLESSDWPERFAGETCRWDLPVRLAGETCWRDLQLLHLLLFKLWNLRDWTLASTRETAVCCADLQPVCRSAACVREGAELAKLGADSVVCRNCQMHLKTKAITVTKSSCNWNAKTLKIRLAAYLESLVQREWSASLKLLSQNFWAKRPHGIGCCWTIR